MGLFDKVFGKTSASGQARAGAKSAAPSRDPSTDPNMIRVYDGYGRELYIPKETWRRDVLPGSIKAAWNDPDQLFSIVAATLSDGYYAEVVEAARHLHKIETGSVRSTCVCGFALMKVGRMDQAEQVYLECMRTRGEDAAVLTNLANVYEAKGDKVKTEKTMWRALELDPNQDLAVMAYVSLCNERAGAAGEIEAFDRIARLPGSWRAQLWMARKDLDGGNLNGAMSSYRRLLQTVPEPLPVDMLMQIGGDLGNAGHLNEIIELVQPHYDPNAHGLQVGNNLIKANIEIGDIATARRLTDQLFAMKRRDWEPTLQYWDAEISKAKAVERPDKVVPPVQAAMMEIGAPIWIRRNAWPADLLPAKAADAAAVAFLGSTAEQPNDDDANQFRQSNTSGRMSRAIPLFLAELTAVGSNAASSVLIPWISSPSSGFVLGGAAWTDAEALKQIRRSPQYKYMVTTHIAAKTEPWMISLRLLRASDGQCLESMTHQCAPTALEDSVPDMARALLRSLKDNTDISVHSMPEWYVVPSDQYLSDYLLRLEQLLAVMLNGDRSDPNVLTGEREIVNGTIMLCVAFPSCINTRMLLAQTLLAMKKARPNILPEFADKVSLLQKEHPITGPAATLIQSSIDKAFGV